MYTYVTFGFDHIHIIEGVTFDRNCVARIDAKSAEEGRAKAFKAFDSKFCMEYFDDRFDRRQLERFYPRGLINLEVQL